MKKLLTIIGAMSLVTSTAFADYPERAVSFIVPFPPGDLEDTLTRMIAEDFEKAYGVSSAVVNKPGGGGGPFPGAIELAGMEPDGYNIGSLVMDVPLVGAYIGIPELNPMPFEPLGIFVTYPFIIAAHKDAPFNTVEELAAHSKDNKVVLAHFGPELTPTQLTLAMSKQLGITYSTDVGVDAVDCSVFASGDADVGNTSLALVLPCIDDLKILATQTEDRIPMLPDTPTMKELTPELSLPLWNGLFVHKDTPADVREKIVAVAKETMASERAQELAAQTGAFVYWKDAAESIAQIETDSAVLGLIGETLK